MYAAAEMSMMLCETLCIVLKVFNAYASKKSLVLTDCKFVCDGNILNGTQTAAEVMPASHFALRKAYASKPLLQLSMHQCCYLAGPVGRWGCH